MSLQPIDMLVVSTESFRSNNSFHQVYTVYILYSDSGKKHYVGFTANIEQRLIAHNHLGKKGFTTRYRPWKIIHTDEFQNKNEAMK